jgi:hypothetical protein
MARRNIIIAIRTKKLMPTTTLGYERSNWKWSPRRSFGVLAVTLLLYPISYFALRATRVIVHYKDMERDIVAPTVGTKLPGLGLFTPLMRLEGKVWHRGDRRAG